MRAGRPRSQWPCHPTPDLLRAYVFSRVNVVRVNAVRVNAVRVNAAPVASPGSAGFQPAQAVTGERVGAWALAHAVAATVGRLEAGAPREYRARKSGAHPLGRVRVCALSTADAGHPLGP